MPDLALRHQAAQVAVNAKTQRELAVAWRLLDTAALDRSFPAYLVAALRIVAQNRALSTAAALAYISAHRRDVLGDSGILLPADPAPLEQIGVVARVTSVVPIKQATAAGIALDAANAAAFVLSSGGLARIVLEGGRDTIIGSAIAEPRVKGWERVVVGATCSFCVMLAGRGAVFTESTVRFRAHSGCDCSAREVLRD